MSEYHRPRQVGVWHTEHGKDLAESVFRLLADEPKFSPNLRTIPTSVGQRVDPIDFTDDISGYSIFVLTTADFIEMGREVDSDPSPRTWIAPRISFAVGRAMACRGPDKTVLFLPQRSSLDSSSEFGCATFKYSETKRRSGLLNVLRTPFIDFKRVVDEVESRTETEAQGNMKKRGLSVRQEMAEAETDQQALAILQRELKWLAELKSEATSRDISDTLTDIVIGMVSLLDVVNVEQLERLQDMREGEVFVYAPHPLEAEDSNAGLRETVRRNALERGVKYYYFVDKEEGVQRIDKLVTMMAQELTSASESGDGEALRDADKTLRECISVVVLPDFPFLTYYTVQHSGDDTIVLQSIVQEDRDDVLLMVDDAWAQRISGWISRVMANVEEKPGYGVKVLKPTKSLLLM